VKNEKRFSGWFDNSEKEDVSGQLERLRGWFRGYTPPQECFRLPPTYFWTTWHQTRAFQWKLKSDLSGWYDNSEKGDVYGHFESFRGWSRGCTPPQECCRLLPTYFWVTWHQSRAFLISMKNEKWFKKGDVSGHFEHLWGWSRGCTPPQEGCRLPPTNFLTTWHQPRAFLISRNNEKWSFLLVWQFLKRRYVWAFWALLGLIPWLHSASGILQTTAYLLLGHMAPN